MTQLDRTDASAGHAPKPGRRRDHTRDADKNIVAKGNKLRSLIC